MSIEQLETSLTNLPPEERRRFAEWFHAHEDELIPGDIVHPEVQQEILGRREAALLNPKSLEPWEGTTERVRTRLNEVRNQKTKGR
jgi:hypothetical protein